MKLALNGQQLASTHDLSKLCDVLDQFKVRAVELWPANIPGGSAKEEYERYEKKDIAAAAKLLKARGIEVACVTLGFWAAPVCIARGGTAALTDALKGTVDAAKVLGAGLVNCYSTGVPLSLFKEAVIPAAEYAAKAGVVITLENEAHDESALPSAVAGIVKAVNSPGFGTQFDPCNYYHGYIEPYPNAYETIRTHIRYVHLKGGCHYDASRQGVFKGSTMRGTDRDFIGYLPLPEAAFSIEPIVRRLKREGYKGFITLEPHVPAAHVLEYYAIEIPFIQNLIDRN